MLLGTEGMGDGSSQTKTNEIRVQVNSSSCELKRSPHSSRIGERERYIYKRTYVCLKLMVTDVGVERRGGSVRFILVALTDGSDHLGGCLFKCYNVSFDHIHVLNYCFYRCLIDIIRKHTFNIMILI